MDKILENIICEAISKKVSDEETFLNLVKANLKGKNQARFPSSIILRKKYQAMLTAGRIEKSLTLEKILVTKKMRSLSGVAIITVLTKPYPCPGKCSYCPSELDVPKSYLSTEPAVMRAILCDYDPMRQVTARLESLELEGHPTDKIELIIIGGTFSYLPRDYQEEFVKDCFDALNGKKSKDLSEAKKKNEMARHRCVGLTLETRPDYIDPDEVEWFRYLGATRVELGVQSVFDEVLALNNRGHDVGEIARATKVLKNAAFKICYHMMPNLPGSNLEKDLEMFKIIFSDERFQPDYIKVYPCVVVKGSELYKWWEEGKYQPYTDEELISLVCEIKKIVPNHIRIMRLIRDIPAGNIEAGSKFSNLRQEAQRRLNTEGSKCRCIRCREAGERKMENVKSKMYEEEYEASGGREIFLTIENIDQSVLFALLRLRLTDEVSLRELEGCALIREVHTYGQQVEVGKIGESQHRGLGKKLIARAEKIALDAGYKKIAVISGVGVRGYYQKLGFVMSEEYLIKFL